MIMKDKTEVEFQAEWKKMGVPANETVLVAVSTGCDSRDKSAVGVL